VYSDTDTKKWVQHGCRSAGIGCLACKKPLVDAVIAELEPMQRRAAQYQKDVGEVRNIVVRGSERARAYAAETLNEVRTAMGLSYR
jgi:tryptophanyl-tRNA synthetase